MQRDGLLHHDVVVAGDTVCMYPPEVSSPRHGTAPAKGARSSLRRWTGAIGLLGLVAAGGALASEWHVAEPSMSQVWLSAVARLDAAPLSDRYWALVLAGVLSLIFTGQRGSARRAR